MTLDRVAFHDDVMDLLKGSPMATLLDKGLHFDLRDWSGDLAEIKELAAAIVASIEIVKDHLKADHPDEPWSHIAIEEAAKILHDSIVIHGFWGHVEDFLLGPIIRAILEGTLGAFKAMATNKDWLALARAVLAIV